MLPLRRALDCCLLRPLNQSHNNITLPQRNLFCRDFVVWTRRNIQECKLDLPDCRWSSASASSIYEVPGMTPSGARGNDVPPCLSESLPHH